MTQVSKQNDHTVSAQWASRPDDQRYLNLEDLHKAVSARRSDSQDHGIALDHMHLAATDDTATSDVVIHDGNGQLASKLNHWSFGQLCQRIGATAKEYRDMPAVLGIPMLSYRMKTVGRTDAKMLINTGEESQAETPDYIAPGESQALIAKPSLAACNAINSDSYGRVWDCKLTGACLENLGTNWKVPGASYAGSDPKRATTLYASDRDVFIFLVDEEKQIEVGGESFFRGFYCWNSEVGSATLGLATFLYQSVCDNRIIWGQAQKTELKIRHTSGAPMRFIREAQPALRDYANAGTAAELEGIKRAQETEIGKDKGSVTDWLKARGFTAGQSGAIFDNAESRDKNPRSVWGLVDGATYLANDITHTDQRVDFERKAGKLLSAVNN